MRPPSRVTDLARWLPARSRWPADSLGRLLAYVRLAHAIQDRHRPDSAACYLGRAWRLAGARQSQQRPAAVVALANELAGQYYVRGNFDSTLYYYQQAARQFREVGPDSSMAPDPATTRPTNLRQPVPHLLAGILANAGSAGRVLGRLPLALRYYERARNLYQRQGNLSGIGWTQCLIGEAYAAQGNYPQAEQAYEQALVTYRRYAQPAANRDPGGGALADVLLNYYLPLLLEGHSSRPPAYASALAAEATALVRPAPYNALLLTRLNLVPVQVALQAGQPAEASPWLSRARTWLRRGATADTAVAGWPARNQPYAEVKSLTLGLMAWQQQPTHPERARSLLAEAVALLTRYPRTAPQPKPRQALARIALAMGEPAAAVALLRPLLRVYQQSGSLLPLSQLTELLTQAYARVGRYDSAYAYSRRTQTLTDTLRQAQQFAALAASEARFRSREQASQIAHLTERERQQARSVRLAVAGAGLLALLALAILLALRITRRLNGRLAVQTVQLQAQAERLQEQAEHLQLQTEHLQAQTERLGEMDAAKNQFFANASHELRTPLTLVLAPLDTLLHAPAQKLPAAARAAVALAHRQAQRLHELVNRILDLTKLEAGQLAVQPVPTAVAPLLRNLLASFEPLAAARGLSLHGPERLPAALHLLLDADKVAQILTNLLGNALNHTPAGGTVTLTAALPAPDGYYTLTVQDTGPGIAPAEQERVFERFYQGKQHQAQGGTGLGLALSRELATLLGGTLTLVSPPGQGATFTLRFPATVLRVESEGLRGEGVNELDLRNKRAETGSVSDDASISPTLNSSSLTLNSTKPRVLVVEDHPDLREYLNGLLAPTYEVLTAADGQDALELLAREAPIDLVITDAMMPRLSGTELLAQLKADPARAGLPVLMLTARADAAHRRAALTVGVDDYLTKPFAPAELLARVQVLLARHNVRRQFAYQPEAAVPAGLAPLTDAVPGTATTEGTGANEQLAQWQAQVAAHLADENFGPAELAGLLAVSERTLYRRLGESAGLTPAAWLRELRLNQARQLLEAGDFRTVVAVAEAVGFASASYFSSLYTERFGRRPSDYRKSKK
ncbi:response regulator [Microvirga sp. STS02]|uniref:ATP-binding protein n=1 Tax=Hymenobacter negativus TaxID=2795026 RepID=UPI0018DEB8DF|nr:MULTISPECIES: ATP-binding protein [Bacteria]MBH8568294.1 response regulator [Hymenobacter negativus]MBR7208029.1 response regulator [Microvirga sp. STS02]